MRLSLLTAGSRGDVQPYVALGKGLRSAGHDVRIATHEGFRDLVMEHGLDFAPVTDPSAALTSAPAWGRWQRSGDDVARYMVELGRISKLARPVIEAMVDGFWAACRGADGVISSTSGIGSLEIADMLGVRHAWALFQPMSPTRHFPHFMSPSRLRLTPRMTLGTYLLAEQVYWRLFRAAVHDRLGGHRSARPDPRGFLGSHPSRVVYGISPRVVAPPPDWNDNIHVCGFWLLDPPAGWRAPADLQAFLEDGPPPVCCHLAGVNGIPPERLADVTAEALRRSGRRGVLLVDGAKTGSDPLPSTIMAVEAVPHAWLFPRVAAVVHHGGAGTTARALWAGVPSVAVPGFYDQPFWSRRVAALGVGPDPIPPRHLTAGRLAAAIERMTTDRAMRSRARRFGDDLRNERGVEIGVERLERFFLHGAVPGRGRDGE